MTATHASHLPRPAAAAPRSFARAAAALAAAAIGLALLIGVGFAHPEAIHNATHDARHAAGFPCH